MSGSTISLPVERIATRGRAKTSTSETPVAASAPILLGLKKLSARENDLPGGDVGGARTDVLPRINRGEYPDAAIIGFLGFLHHHDRVCPIGHRCAGRDLDAFAGRKPLRRHLPGVDRPDAAKNPGIVPARTERVLRDHRVAVHRRAIEGRDIVNRHDVSREDPIAGVAEGHPLGAADWDGCRRQQPACLFERDRLADRPHRRHRSSLPDDVSDLGQDQLGEREAHGLFRAGECEHRGAAD